MAIGIYTKPHEDYQISKDDTRTNPLNIAINGRDGGVIYFKLYVRNDELKYWYSNINVGINCAFSDLIDGSKGFSWKLKESEFQPTIAEWDAITGGNIISLSNNLGSASYGNIHTYLPFWLRVEVPANEPAHQIKSISLQLTCKENLVG